MNDSDFFRFRLLIEQQFVFALRNRYDLLCSSHYQHHRHPSPLFSSKIHNRLIELRVSECNTTRRNSVSFFLRIESKSQLSRARQIYDFSYFSFRYKKVEFLNNSIHHNRFNTSTLLLLTLLKYWENIRWELLRRWLLQIFAFSLLSSLFRWERHNQVLH